MSQTISFTPKQEETNPQNPSVHKQHSKKLLNIKQIIILFLELVFVIPLGLVLYRLQFGGMAWIFGGIISGAVIFQSSRVFYQYTPKHNRTARKIGLTLVGLAIGFSNTRANLADIAIDIPIFILLTSFLLVSGCAIGYFYSRLSKTNILTAMLATVPGGVGVMSAIAADYGKNVTQVALVQVIRVTSVILLIPLLARKSAGNLFITPTSSLVNNLFSFDISNLGLLCLALLLATLTVSIAVFCKMPAANFIGALFVGVIFNPLLNLLPFVNDINFIPPAIINILGQILLGITIGEYWGDKPNFGKRNIAYALISCLMTLLAGICAAVLAMEFTGWDWLTCLLVTAPGGAAEIILVSLTLNHHVDIVTAGHLVRLLAINASLPFWLYLFRRLEGITQ